MQPVEAKQASEQSSPIDKLVFLLSAIVCLIIWGFTLVFMQRGFDLTDNGLYLLSFLHYEDFTANLSFYNTLIKPLYDFAGSSSSLTRLFGGIVLLLFSIFGSFITIQFFKHERAFSRWLNWAYFFLLMGASALHYNLWLSNTPNYNWLNQIGLILFWSGLLVWRMLWIPKQALWGPFLICLGFCLCLWSKMTTAVFLPFIVLGYLIVQRQHLKTLFSFPAILTGILGFIVGISLLFLQLESPQMLIERFSFAFDLHILKANLYTDTSNNLSRDILELLGFLYPPREYLFGQWYALLFPSLLVLGYGFYMASQPKNQREKHYRILETLLVLGWLVNLFIATTLPFIEHVSSWTLRVYTISLIFVGEAVFIHRLIHRQEKQEEGVGFARAFAWSLFAFFLTAIFSFGTDAPYIAHTSYASYFALFAILILIYYPKLNSLTWLRNIAPIVLILFTAYVLYRSSLEPYRQEASLFEMDVPTSFRFGAESILVDPEMAGYVNQLQEMAERAGYELGVPVIDLTGHSPGAVYILGGHSYVFPWLSGGNDNKVIFVQLVLAAWQREDLEAAWILTVLENPSRETPSSVLVDLGLPFPEGYELVGEIQRPYSDEVQGLWRPIEN